MKKFLLLTIVAVLGAFAFNAQAKGAANRAINFQLRESSSVKTDYRVEIPNTMLDAQASSFTFAAWFSVGKLETVFPISNANKAINQGVIFSHEKRSVSVSNSGSFCVAYDMDGNVLVCSDKNNANLVSEAKVTPGQWDYVAYSYDAPTNRGILYLNGKEVGFSYGKNDSFVWETDNPVFVLGDQNFNGDIDEFQYFNRVLTPEEMAAAADNRLEEIDCLVALFDLNEPVEGTIATYANKAPNGNADLKAVYYKNEYGTSMRGLYSRSSSEEVEPTYTVGRLLPAEYCTIDGNYAFGSNARLTTAMSITGNKGHVYNDTQLQSATDKALYVDHTSRPLSFSRGETVTMQATNTGEWMHCYAYLDLDRDGEFVPVLDEETMAVQPASELMAFNCYSAVCYELEKDGTKPSSEQEGTTYHNSLGESVAASGRPSDPLTFTIPENLRPGDYRLRFKVDWNNIDPCGHPDQQAQTLAANGGCIIDFTLRIVAPAHAEAREITVVSTDETLGLASIDGFATTTVLTDENVTVVATPTDPDAYLVKWTDKNGVEISYSETYEYVSAEANVLTATFRRHYPVTVVKEDDAKVTLRVPLGVVSAGDYVDEGSELTVIATCPFKTLSALWINGENVFDRYDNGYTFTVEGPVEIRPEFVSPLWTISIATEGNGSVVVASEYDETTYEPTGEFYADGDEITDGEIFYIFAIPGENETIESLVVDGDDVDIDSDDVVLLSDGTAIYEYAAVDDVVISAKFTDTQAAITDITAAPADARYYNLQGVEVGAASLMPGVYVCRTADKTYKVVIR